MVESVQEVKEQPATKVSFQDSKALKNRVAKLEKMLEEAELDLESLRDCVMNLSIIKIIRKWKN